MFKQILYKNAFLPRTLGKLTLSIKSGKYFSVNTKSENVNPEFKYKSSGLSKRGTEEEASIGNLTKKRENFTSKSEKEKRTKLLQQEITSNPEFFNAFPYLKEKVKTDYMENELEEVSDYVSKHYTIPEGERAAEKRSDYFESMLNKHRGYTRVLKTEEELKQSTIAEFNDGYHTRTGPIKYMSRDEKEKVHLEIDRKMQELEESGLSRQEILFNAAEGIPLREDKFFQFIKNNKIAREMLVKPTETLTVDLVVERALKQDIGPDASLALNRKNMKLQEDLPLSYELNHHTKPYNPKLPDEMLKKNDFDYTENYVDKLKLQLNSERKKPFSFVNPPLMRHQARRKYMIKTIQKKDIHWRNLPLLARFLNEGGKILNKYQSRLPGDIQRKLARTVKQARHMGLLPNTDFVRSFHKLPFTSLYNEFQEDVSKVVDKKTGTIRLVHQPNLQDKYSYSSYSSAVEASKASDDNQQAEKFKNALLLDKSEIPFSPNMEQRDLLLAQNHLIKTKQEKTNDSKDKLMYNENSLLEKQEKSAFEKVYKNLSVKTSNTSIIESFISEKSYDVEQLNSDKKTLLNENVQKHKIKEEISKTMESINDLIMKFKLDKVKPIDYQQEYSNSRNYKIEPKMSNKNMNKKFKEINKISYKI